MSTQSPLPQNDPMLIAFQKLQQTSEFKNAVNWTIKAENERQAAGELWFAFAAGYTECLTQVDADEVKTAEKE